MASTSSPYGLQPVADQGGLSPRTVRFPLGIVSGYATNIFKGQPINLNATTNTIQAVTLGTQSIFGIFAGVEYTPLGGRPVVSPFWPAGTVYDPSYDMMVYYYPAWLDTLRVRVQASGSLSQNGTIGQQYNLNNLTAGNTAIGLSYCTLNSAAPVALGSLGQLAVIEFDTSVNSAPGDAFTDVICMITQPQIAPTVVSIG